jgi:regulation of enolase protein 1 (concanavalin A-like superfamily)
MNGVFQITSGNDPLVWHSDSQDYAAAIYLTKDGPTNAGTSFWKDKKYGCRRPPSHSLENKIEVNFPRRKYHTVRWLLSVSCSLLLALLPLRWRRH